MVHERLPTCEKINRIVEKEQKYGRERERERRALVAYVCRA